MSPRIPWLAACVFAAQMIHAQTFLDTNLIVNGNAESGPAGTATGVVASIPGWTRGTGNVNVLPYNITNYLQPDDPAPQDHGFQYFIGGTGATGATSTLTQIIDVSAATSAIAANNIKYIASANLGAIPNNGGSRHVELAIAFENSAGQTFKNISLISENFNPGGLYLQQQIGLVPIGTSKVALVLTFTGTNSAADSLSLVFTPLGTSPLAVLNSNLVVNSGAETGPSATAPNITLYVPGWSTTQGLSVAPYGGPNWISLTAPGPVDRGVKLFCGSSANPAMYQDIDVSPAASLIDAGQVNYQVDAWLGGMGGASPTLTYAFFDWAGNQVSATGQLGPVRPSGAGLLNASRSDTLPAGTRRVRITLAFGSTSFMADNISFSLTATGQANVILPQVAFGGGWYTALYFTNLTNGAVSFTVSFIAEDGQPLTVPSLNASSVTVNLSARGSGVVEALNSGPLVTAYASAALPVGVKGYGVFRGSNAGVPDQEAVVPFSGVSATSSNMVFDDTGYVTGVAIVNLSASANAVTITAQDKQGNPLGTATVNLGARAKTALVLRNIPGLSVAGNLGSADFSVPSGNSVAVLGLRFNGQAFTSIPTSDR